MIPQKTKPRCCVNLSDTRLKRLQNVQPATVTMNPKQKVKQWLLRQRAYRLIDISSRKTVTCNSPLVDQCTTVPETPMKTGSATEHAPPSMACAISSPPGLFTSSKLERHGETKLQLETSSGKAGRLRRFMTPKAKSEKRKRYFMNKKSKHKEIDSTTGQLLNDSTEPLLHSDSNSVSSIATSYPGKHYFKSLMIQAENSRITQEQKMNQLKNEHGSFIDASPCFPTDEQKIILPECLTGIEKVEVKAKIDELLQNENKALFHARFFRNRCTELEEQIRRLKNEKEGVRFFWRNKVLEGQTRAGRMLKIATSKE